MIRRLEKYLIGLSPWGVSGSKRSGSGRRDVGGRRHSVPRQVVGRISSSKVRVVVLARSRWTSRGRFQAMASWGRPVFVLDVVVLGPFGQGERVGDPAWEQPLVGQRLKPAFA